MITDDPIRDLERQLVKAAAAPRRAPRHRRRWHAALVAAAAVTAAAFVIIAVGTPADTRLTLAQAAAAQLAPGGGVIHLSYTSTIHNGPRVVQRIEVSTWYSATTTHTLATSTSADGRTSSLETVRRGRLLRSFESSQNVLTLQTVCSSSPAGNFSDPVARLRELLRQGRLTPDGTQRFAGVSVQRLAYSAGPLHIVFLVHKSGSAPVAMITSLSGGRDRTVVRFTGRASLPKTAASQTLLAMAPHPGARIVRLARAC
jgi:hypothetical protein